MTHTPDLIRGASARPPSSATPTGESHERPQSRRVLQLAALQVLRGLCAWTVVLVHIVQSYYQGHAPNAFWADVTRFGQFSVDTFFMISGVVMAIVAQKYVGRGAKFALNRAQRIMPAYWVFTTILVLSVVVLPSGTYLTSWTPRTLIESFLFIPNHNPNGIGIYPTLYVGWTIFFELIFYLIFTLCLMQRRIPGWLPCCAALTVLALSFWSHGILRENPFILFEFALGMALFRTLDAVKSGRRGLQLLPEVPILAAFLGMAVMLRVLGVTSPTGVQVATGMLVAIPVLAATLVVDLFDVRILGVGRLVQSRFLLALGDYSYSTYLAHIIVIGWVYALVHSTWGHGLQPAAVPAVMVLTLLVSWLSYRMVELRFARVQLRVPRLGRRVIARVPRPRQPAADSATSTSVEAATGLIAPAPEAPSPAVAEG